MQTDAAGDLRQCLLCLRKFQSDDMLAAHLPQCAKKIGAPVMCQEEETTTNKADLASSPKKRTLSEIIAEGERQAAVAHREHEPLAPLDAAAPESMRNDSLSPTGRTASARDLLASRRQDRTAITGDWCKTAMESLQTLQQENNEKKEKMTRSNTGSFTSWDGRKYCRISSPPVPGPAADEECGPNGAVQNADGEVPSPPKRSLSAQPPSRSVTFSDCANYSVAPPDASRPAPEPQPFQRSSTAESPCNKRSFMMRGGYHHSPDELARRSTSFENKMPRQTVKRGSPASVRYSKNPAITHRDPGGPPTFMNATTASMRRSAGSVGAVGTYNAATLGVNAAARIQDISQRARTAQKRVVAVAVTKRVPPPTTAVAKPLSASHLGAPVGKSGSPTPPASGSSFSLSLGHRLTEIPATVAHLNMRPQQHQHPSHTAGAKVSQPRSHVSCSIAVVPSTTVVQTSAAVARFCSECGQRYVSDGAKFCVQCGHRREFVSP